MLEFFKGWEDIDEIIHMGTISSTTETNEEALNSYNVNSPLDYLKGALSMVSYQVCIICFCLWKQA